ncbi:Peptidyl serine alpha-galactosyltransferase [Hondaea fermentalgiana]|uniref:Peptidyl serine alpha-galactosyltransferase n=1 Tax=Hondaea fermentalgiana TaxID=2315210 RepID=A0A2R5GAG2_9STRA|nr:Peptidyl serine alpha-galactosyltransferase [Hondaea fermentalgiana]|eukprot:GBG25071.1 Peptidyl serine alpha-galactosyltransferase [Hondaea fermentalgiana]
MRLEGGPEIDFYASCQRDGYYVGSLFASEGCVERYNYPSAKSFRFVWQSSLQSRRQIPDSVLDAQWAQQDHKPRKPLQGQAAKARIVFSCESSEYFGYQVWANFYAFLTSGQSSATWTRLLTAGMRDDLADNGQVPGLATFQAKRTLYSRRYSPINKPDVITKWFESSDRPREEVIVVIDPDNWLLKDVGSYVDRVTPGHAIGEPAYYHGSRTAQRLWKEVCLQNCDVDVDLVGVPYIVHRDDLAAIAPLWRSYTIMLKDRVAKDSDFKQKYGHLDLAWASEMFGYNFAAAHVGVRHEVVRRIQVRDVDSEHRADKLQGVSMIHVGRAWFPKTYAPAQKWAHTEGKSFSHFGQQVWCKCNNTASTVIPWPLPPDADFQSTKTLEILHNSMERFGPIPENAKFRRGVSRGTYGASLD